MGIIKGAQANLFSIDGKLPVAILSLDSDCAIVALAAPPPAGSIAILVRNGVRIFCTVGWTAGSDIGLMFDEPLADDPMEMFATGMPNMAAPMLFAA